PSAGGDRSHRIRHPAVRSRRGESRARETRPERARRHRRPRRHSHGELQELSHDDAERIRSADQRDEQGDARTDYVNADSRQSVSRQSVGRKSSVGSRQSVSRHSVSRSVGQSAVVSRQWQEIDMKTAGISLVIVLVLASGSFGPANAAADKPLPVPGYEAAQDLPGARELPDSKTDYKVVFADAQDAKNPGDVNPMLPTIATYITTLAKYAAPADPRHIVIMFHHRTPDADIVMTNEAYRERYNRDNPNIAIIHALKQAGVDIRVCGQGILARKIDPKQVNPDISI